MMIVWPFSPLGLGQVWKLKVNVHFTRQIKNERSLQLQPPKLEAFCILDHKKRKQEFDELLLLLGLLL